MTYSHHQPWFLAAVTAIAVASVIAAPNATPTPKAEATPGSTATPAPTAAPTPAAPLTVVERGDRTSPRVALSVVLPIGSADETVATAGWRRLLADAMLRAIDVPATSPIGKNTALNSTQLLQAADEAGGRLGLSVGDDTIEFWAVGSSANSIRLLELLAQVVRHPRLADEDIDAARKRLLTRQSEENVDVAARAVTALHSQLYKDMRGALVAYGLPPSGTAGSLSQLGNDKVRDFYKRYVSPSRVVLGVAGDLDSATLRTAATALLASSQVGAPATMAPRFAAAGTQPPLVVRQMQTPGAWVFVGYTCAGMTSGDLPALRVLAALLGESSPSRLSQRLLTKNTASSTEALAKQVAVQFTPRRYGSELIIFAQTDPENVDNVDSVKNAILDEMHKIAETRPTGAELEHAKNFVRGNWAVEREGLHERAFRSAHAAALDSPADADWPVRLRSVTAADIQRVAKKYLQHYAVALIMPQE